MKTTNPFTGNTIFYRKRKPITMEYGYKKSNRLRTKIITKVKFRIGDGRDSIENDSGSNMAIRFYILKNEDLRRLDSNGTSLDNGELSKESKSIVYKDINILYNGVDDFVQGKLSLTLEPQGPTRCMIHYHEDDEFYSIVLGFKIKRNLTAVKIADLRYYVGSHALKNNCLLLFINNYNSEDPIGSWDHEHIKEGPIENFSNKKLSGEIIQRLKSTIEPETIQKPSRRNISSRKRTEVNSSSKDSSPSYGSDNLENSNKEGNN